MKNLLLFVLALSALLALGACRNSNQPTRAQFCSPEQAQAIGFDHGSRNIDPVDNIEGVCLREDQMVVIKAYQAGYQDGAVAFREARKRQVCNYDYGYRDGYNTGSMGLPMFFEDLSMCDAAGQRAAEKGFREGYDAGVEVYEEESEEDNYDEYDDYEVDDDFESSSTTEPRRKVNKVHVGSTADHNSSKLTNKKTLKRKHSKRKRPEPECIEAYGEEVCGYGCVEAYGQVVCGDEPGMECLEAYGEIKCGYGCVEAYGNIVCGDEPGMECLEAYGEIKCGYGCVEAYGQVVCGDEPGMECLDAFGDIQCGYDCVEALGTIVCGTNPGDNCVVSGSEVKCGENCRERKGRIRCD